MKYQIRKGIWETNSSSVHSISVQNGDWVENPSAFLKVNPDDNKVHVTFGDFGWGYDRYTNPYNKLQYALCMAVQTEKPETKEDIPSLNGYRAINDLISEKLQCDGIFIDSKMENRSYENRFGDRIKYVVFDDDDDAGIDHQSCEDYHSLQEFLDDYSITLEEFIFNTKYILIIDNDNHY